MALTTGAAPELLGQIGFATVRRPGITAADRLSRRNRPHMTEIDPESPSQIEKLCRRLILEPLDRDLFLADPGAGEGRLFGGLVAAQSVLAAMATVDKDETGGAPASSQLHSIHAYFLRPGRYELPIRFVFHALVLVTDHCAKYVKIAVCANRVTADRTSPDRSAFQMFAPFHHDLPAVTPLISDQSH